ncbi:MAG: uncharacterized protein K0S65_5655, partial [Labilithrix sp.]|nr:uncharacterized protein [Labilithrix sp.]
MIKLRSVLVLGGLCFAACGEDKPSGAAADAAPSVDGGGGTPLDGSPRNDPDAGDAGGYDDGGSTIDGGADSGIADYEPGEEKSAGTATVPFNGSNSFLQLLAGLDDLSSLSRFSAGQTVFKSDFGVPLLGPTYNSTSCIGCHVGNGRGPTPSVSGGALRGGGVLRVSIPGKTAEGGPLPHPLYGTQIQSTANRGVPEEGTVYFHYEEALGSYADGTAYQLLRPTVVFAPNLGVPEGPLLLSPRVGPSLIGLGFLQAIAEADILAKEDSDDADGDGISGHANWVWDAQSKKRVLGRFGWKANEPTLLQQSAGALLEDMGVASSLFPHDNCPPLQTQCVAASNQGLPEADPASTAFFMRTT